MLSEERIKKMIRLSDYEYGLGEQDIRRTRFRKSDYIRYQVVKAIGCLIAACILIIVLISLYNIDRIKWSDIASDGLFATVGLLSVVLIVVGLILFFAIFTAVCRKASRREYEESEARLTEYDATLKELIALYEDERKEESV